MKRLYKCTVETDRETASNVYRVYQPNIQSAAKAAMRAYRKDPGKLYGHARVTDIRETGTIDG